MRTRHSVLLCASLMSLVGCMNPSGAPQVSRSMNLDSVPSLPSVDPKTLMISDIQVAQFANPEFDGAPQPLVNFRYSGTAEYVEITSCVESENSCSQPKDIFQTKSTLANAPGGARVVVKLRACVSAQRSTTASNCGEWYTSEYTQWTVTDQAKARLQEELEAIEVETKELRKQLETVLKLRSERANKCKSATPEQNAALEADKAFADSLAKLGQSGLGLLANGLIRKTTGSCPNAPQGASNLQLTGSGLGSIIGPNIFSPDNLKTIVDKISEALKKRSSASSKPSADSSSKPSGDAAASDPANKDTPAGDGGAGAAAQCLAEQTTPKGPRLTLDDIGAVLPDIASAIFDLGNAERQVKLQGICLDKLGSQLERSLALAEVAAQNTAARLQERIARIKRQK